VCLDQSVFRSVSLSKRSHRHCKDQLSSITATIYQAREISFEMLGTPEKRCLLCTGTPVKTAGNFGSRNHVKGDLLRPWSCMSLLRNDEFSSVSHTLD